MIAHMKMKNIWEKYISVAAKGFVIGGTMLVPGVSGGSMAMILGIYSSLISAVSSFYQRKKDSFCFLFTFCIGAVIGMALLANPISDLIDAFPKPMMYFFIGAVVGGIPMMFREANIQSFSWKVPVYILLGMLMVCAISILPLNSESIEQSNGIFELLLLFFAGIIAAIALLLPGISISYLLLLLGLYSKTITAIKALQFSFLLPMALGGLVGIILMAKLLEKAMARYPQVTYLVILGFILGSVVSIFPGLPTLSELLSCSIAICGGFAAIYFLPSSCPDDGPHTISEQHA